MLLGLFRSKVQKPTVPLGLPRSKAQNCASQELLPSKAQKQTVSLGLLRSKAQKPTVPLGLLQSKARNCASRGLLPSKARKQTVPLGLPQSKARNCASQGLLPSKAGKSTVPLGLLRSKVRNCAVRGPLRSKVGKFSAPARPGKSPSARNKEALFPGRVFCRIRAVFARNLCAFHRVAFFAAQSDECVAAGKRAAAAGGRSRRAREAHP